MKKMKKGFEKAKCFICGESHHRVGGRICRVCYWEFVGIKVPHGNDHPDRWIKPEYDTGLPCRSWLNINSLSFSDDFSHNSFP